jgi:hypothetical protein
MRRQAEQMSLRREALDAADQVVRNVAVSELIRCNLSDLAGTLMRLPAITSQSAAKNATSTIRSVARASRSSVVVAALFSAFYAAGAHEEEHARNAIHAAEVAGERSRRLLRTLR